MPASPDLLQSIDAIGARSFSGELYRHTAPDREPLSGASARAFGGRWNPRDSFSTIYLAQPVEACVGEFLRMAAGQGRGAESFLPRDIHTVAANDLLLVDLTYAASLASVGIEPTDISAVDWGPCQRVGEAVYFLGYQGLMAPSASGVGIVMAVFETRVRPDQLKVITKKPMSRYV